MLIKKEANLIKDLIMKTLVIYGHPDYQNSFANKTILEEFQKNVPDAEIRNIVELYPDGKIDIETEQKKLLDADVLIFEFPFWWYSCPSAMHNYLEKVFTRGFAYGEGGQALQETKFILSFTTGGNREAYTKDGYQHYDIRDFMPQFIAMANLTGMKLADTIVSYGMVILDPDDKVHNSDVEDEARAHGRKLAEAVLK